MRKPSSLVAGLAIVLAAPFATAAPASAADMPESYYERPAYRAAPREREVVVEERRPVYVEEEDEPVVEEYVRPRPPLVVAVGPGWGGYGYYGRPGWRGGGPGWHGGYGGHWGRRGW